MSGVPDTPILDISDSASASKLGIVSAEPDGYTATKHQREVGTGYFDQVAQTVSGGDVSTLALKESTETEQF